MSQSEVVNPTSISVGVIEHNIFVAKTMAATITITYGKTLCEEWMAAKATQVATSILAKCIVEQLRANAGKDS